MFAGGCIVAISFVLLLTFILDPLKKMHPLLNHLVYSAFYDGPLTSIPTIFV